VNSKANAKILVAALMLSAQLGFANGLNNQNNNTGTGTTNTSGGLTNSNSLPVAAVNPQLAANAGVSQAGKDAADKQKKGMNAALLSAAFSAAIAAATCPNPKMQAVCTAATLGTLAGLAVAGMMNNAKNKSEQQTSGVTSGSTGATGGPIASNRSYAETKKKISEVAKMAGNQVDVDKGTAKLADGRELGVKDLSSPSAMASAGLKPGEIKALNDILANGSKKAADQLAKGQDGEPSGEVGGGGTSTVYNDAPAGGGSGGDVASRKPADMSDAVRDYNGTQIGVGSANIFTMMSRRYVHTADQKKPGFL